MAQLDFRLVPNRLGGNNLAYNGFLYRVKNNRGERTYWKCTTPTCPATINTKNNTISGIGQHPHNHQADHAKLVAKDIMNLITTKCQNEIRPVPSIYQEEMTKLRDDEWDDDSREVVEKIPTFYSLKSTLYRARRKQTPKLPTTTTDIQLEGKWTQTTTGQQFLLFDDTQGPRIIAFATTENLTHLSTSDRIYCDGTFYTCPSLFHQIYTIHVQLDGSMYPVVYALLPGKSEQIYRRFFTLLQTAMTDNNLDFTPPTVFMDFETAAHNGIRSVVRGVQVKGCFFHFTQCIWRKAQATGLQIPYQNNDDVRQLVRRAAALPLVPVQQVEDAWFNSMNDLEDTELPVNTIPFTDYVVNQWIDSDITLWNHHDTEGARTTNHLEAWHGKLKRKVQHSHPNIFTLIQTFKDIQAANEITIIQLQAGGAKRPRPKKYRTIDSRISTLKDRLASNTLGLMDYLDAVSQLLHLG